MPVWNAFNGMVPGVSPAHLKPGYAQKAVNCFIGKADALYPERNPLALPDKLVNVDGTPFTGTPRQMWRSGSVFVAWDHWVHVVDDPRRWGSENAFLFVDNGKIWRSSDVWINQGAKPRAIGIGRPNQAPTIRPMGAKTATFSVPPAHLPVNSTDTPASCPSGAQAGEVRSYVVCCVNDMLEESAPSDPSEVVYIQPEEGVTVTFSGTPPEGTVSYRWYRTLPGKHLSEYQFVAETTLPVLADLQDALSLSDPIETRDHFPPPENIEGITRLGSQDVLIWSGNTAWPSVPRLPHAFSPVGRLDVPYSIITARSVVPITPEQPIGLAYTAFLLTDRQPFMVYPIPDNSKDGSPHLTAGIHSINVDEPCVGPQCATSGEGSVFYCTPRGILEIGAGRLPRAMTDELFTLQSWEDWRGGQYTLAYNQGRIFGLSEDISFILAASFVDKDRAHSISYSTVTATAAYVERSANLILSQPSGQILQWGAGIGNMQAEWTSRLVQQPEYFNPGALKVDMDLPLIASRTAREAIALWRDSGESVQEFLTKNPHYEIARDYLLYQENPAKVEVYKEGRLYARKIVDSRVPRRLPRQGKGIYWSIKIITDRTVYRVMLTKAIKDMAHDTEPQEIG